MDANLEKIYQASLRELVRTEGEPVLINRAEEKRWPNDPELWTGPYGWRDDRAAAHLKTCLVIIPDCNVTITEVSYSDFRDTLSDNTQTVGINATSRPSVINETIACMCGEYTHLTLRVEKPLGAILRSILGLDLKTLDL